MREIGRETGTRVTMYSDEVRVSAPDDATIPRDARCDVLDSGAIHINWRVDGIIYTVISDAEVTP